MSAELALSLHASLDQLPADAGDIFEAARRGDFALGAEWFRNMVETGLPPEVEPCFAVLSRGAETVAIVPLQQRHRSLGSLTNAYTSLYMPLIAAGPAAGETARLLGREFGRLCATRPIVRLDALPLEWRALDAFEAGLRESGLQVRRFAHFGNWQQNLAGASWPAYLAARPGMLRELLRRKPKQSARTGQIEFEIIRDAAEIGRAVAVYEAVYRRSWKPDEPCPLFNAGLIREAACLGALHLAIAWRRGDPIAVQLWIVANGRATVMKLAHDMAHAALSPGTMLTANVIEALIGEGVEMIDFGRGDDPYKRLWAGERRQRIGLILVNPRRPHGLATLALHDAGLALRRFRPDPAPHAPPG
ncbi:MAG TPA: GNAT family N-acetyltransferase [Stellaceae bacterium]|nr:GNAT family N-acetyltransferase [Stellaceae bacterium]